MMIRSDLMPARFQELADYNTECARSVVHSLAQDDRMVILQEDFNVWARRTSHNYMLRRQRQGSWWRWVAPRLWGVTR